MKRSKRNAYWRYRHSFMLRPDFCATAFRINPTVLMSLTARSMYRCCLIVKEKMFKPVIQYSVAIHKAYSHVTIHLFPYLHSISSV